jgi:sarcosine oxidase subunit beta
MAAPVSPSPDVVVVGAGVIGCSIAYRLAAEGRRVLLLERRGVCSGASGRNGGMTGAGSSMHARSAAGRAVYALTTRNLDLLRGLELELGCDFQLRLPGSLDVITTPEQHAHLAESVAEQRAAGIPVQMLDPRETRTLMPALAPDILGAAYAPGRGHLWPFALVNGFADAARRHGADIRTWTSVDGFLRDDERVVGVVARGEAIPAGDVVLATNAYAPELLPELPPGAIVPARGQILVTEPVAPFLPLPFGTNFDKEYGRQTTGGQILCGGYRRLDEAEGLGTCEERVTAPVLSGIARCLGRLFPALRSGGVNVVRAWSGIMGFTADGIPFDRPLRPHAGPDAGGRLQRRRFLVGRRRRPRRGRPPRRSRPRLRPRAVPARPLPRRCRSRLGQPVHRGREEQPRPPPGRGSGPGDAGGRGGTGRRLSEIAVQ